MWSKEFPKRVGYYWCRNDDGDFIIEVSGGAPGTPIVVYLGDESVSKRKFQSQWRGMEYYGPLQMPE